MILYNPVVNKYYNLWAKNVSWQDVIKEIIHRQSRFCKLIKSTDIHYTRGNGRPDQAECMCMEFIDLVEEKILETFEIEETEFVEYFKHDERTFRNFDLNVDVYINDENYFVLDVKIEVTGNEGFHDELVEKQDAILKTVEEFKNSCELFKEKLEI